MIPDTRTRVLLFAIVVAALIGLIDAATAGTWDLVTVFALIAVSGAIAAIRHGGRATLTIRRDLARWLAIRAADGGEPVGKIADRAVAAYRAGLTTAAEDRERA